MSRLIDAIAYLIIIATIVLCVVFFVTNICNAADSWTINDIPISRIDNLSSIGQVLAGAALSAGVHCLGHHLVAGALGVGLEQRGLAEWKPDNISSFKNDAIDIGGFIVQMSVGSILTALVPGKFSDGYNAWSAIEVTTYPLIFGVSDGHGDLGGGTGDAAYFILTGWSIINLNGGKK